ncbi:MAG: group II intron reverse transcriptase/maturase, partial [Candidatus Binatia bacterium]
WEKVEENAGGPGVDGISVEVFGLTIEEEIPRLQNALRHHTYHPQPLLRVQVNKPQGGLRALAIPTVRDRVAQTAVAQVITPILEAEFEDVSFGYRRGRSVAQALFQVRRYRDEGYQWVVDADLDAFFDTVDWSLLLARLKQSIPDPDIVRLVKLWLRADIREGARLTTPTKGIPQGAPVSPVLANLYLDRFDEEMMRQGYKLVRFADDFLILCKEKPRAEKALQLTEALLKELRLSLKLEKTRLTHFDQGFHYLGTLFLRTLHMPAPRKKEQQKELQRSTSATKAETAVAQALDDALEKAGKTLLDFPSVAPALIAPPVESQLRTPASTEPVLSLSKPALSRVEG